MAYSNFSKQHALVSGGLLKPSIELCYGPWNSLQEAFNGVKAELGIGQEGDLQIIPLGLTVGVIDGNGIKEYWFKNGRTIADLVEKGGTTMKEGVIVIDKSKPLAGQISKENSVYEFNEDVNLGGTEVAVGKGSTLVFSGGKIKNGTLVFNGNLIECGPLDHIFDNVSISGTATKVGGLTPDNFGAVGDGVANDGAAVSSCALTCHILGIEMFIPNKAYYIERSVLTATEMDTVKVKLNIRGSMPNRSNYLYAPNEYGGIVLGEGVSMFENVTFSGTIRNCGIYGKSRQGGNIMFKNCTISASCICNNTISQLEAFCQDTSLSGTSVIRDNVFLTVYYFSKYESKGANCIDSFITDNYINGGAERNDNACFQWQHYNGSVISNNFVDYYRTIYEPKSNNTTVVGCIESRNNQYQVFLYFYRETEKVNAINLNSIGDCFNWTDKSKLAKLREFVPLTYQDGGNTYEVPTYVARIAAIDRISITEASCESNMGNILYVAGYLSYYQYNSFKLSIRNIDNMASKVTYKVRSGGGPVFNNGTYPHNRAELDGFVIPVDTLPTFSVAWCNVVPGMKYIKDGIIYEAQVLKSASGTNEAKWVEMNRAMPLSVGALSQLPRKTPVGAEFFAKDMKMDGAQVSGAKLYHIGNEIWLDAFGNIAVADSLNTVTFPKGDAENNRHMPIGEEIVLKPGEELMILPLSEFPGKQIQIYFCKGSATVVSFQLCDNTGYIKRPLKNEGNIDMTIDTLAIYPSANMDKDLALKVYKSAVVG